MIADLSPEEQIQRVARSFLAVVDRERPGRRDGVRPDLRGLITMIDLHLEGRLPPIRVVADREPPAPPRRPRAASRR